jgi:hypothetical protein
MWVLIPSTAQVMAFCQRGSPEIFEIAPQRYISKSFFDEPNHKRYTPQVLTLIDEI